MWTETIKFWQFIILLKSINCLIFDGQSCYMYEDREDLTKLGSVSFHYDYLESDRHFAVRIWFEKIAAEKTMEYS